MRNDNAASLERAGFAGDIWKRIPGLTTPLLLIYGSRDAGAVTAAKRFRSELPAAEEFCVPGAGHHPLFESGETLDVLRDFLQVANTAAT